MNIRGVKSKAQITCMVKGQLVFSLNLSILFQMFMQTIFFPKFEGGKKKKSKISRKTFAPFESCVDPSMIYVINPILK